MPDSPGPAPTTLASVPPSAGPDQLYHLAKRRQDAGKPAEAATLLRSAIRLRPAFVEAHHALGCALASLGFLEEGLLSIREAIRLDPHFVLAHFDQGDILERQGDLEGAVACFRQCLAIRPDFVKALNNLGNALHSLGRPEEAIGAYEEALRLQPDLALVHNNLANALVLDGRVDSAIEHYLAAVKIKPDYSDAHFNLAYAYRLHKDLAGSSRCFQRCLELNANDVAARSGLGDTALNLGELQEASSHFKDALKIDPNSALVLCAVARNDLENVADVSIARLRRLLAGPGLSAPDASLVHYTLGKLLDRAGEYDLAFSHYRQANDWQRSFFLKHRKGFDASGLTDYFDRIARTFTRDYFQRFSAQGADAELPIFIVGMPRSGSTLVEQVLASHPQVFGADEIADLTRIVRSLPARLGVTEAYPECMLQGDPSAFRAAALEYVARLEARGGSAIRVTDKTLGNFAHLGLIATLLPRARIVHCRRHPLDVCLSCYFQSFNVLNFTFDFRDLAHYFREYERLMAHWRDVLPVPVFDVVYEEMVADPERISRELIAFCGLDWDERCLSFYETRRPVHTASMLQVRQPIYKNSVGRWRHYAAHIRPLQEALGLLLRN